MERRERLDVLLDRSLDKAEELLNLEIDLGNPFAEPLKVASLQKDLVVSLINAGIKVDENVFRKKSADALQGILEQINTAEKTLNINVVVGTPDTLL